MTKEISKKEVEKICDLSNLEVDDKEKNKFTEELGDILNYIEKLNQLDTSGVKPTAYPVKLRNVLREDNVEESIEKEEVLKNAPDKVGDQFKVPPIINEED